MEVNITVVTHNRSALTKVCLRSLLKKTAGEYSLTIVDNASDDGTQKYIQHLAATHPHVRAVCLRTNMGVAVAANLGWAAVDADYYVKLDNDIEIRDAGWLEQLVAVARNNATVGMAGYLLSDWHCSRNLVALPDGRPFIASDLCNGGCVLIPRRIHEELGFWIEDHGIYGYEDKNYSDRAVAAGYLVGYVPADPLPVFHMGFEAGRVDTRLERQKKSTVESKEHGEQLYVFNKLLFASGIRKLYVERRYIPEFFGERVRFSINPAYLPIIRLQEEYLDKIRYLEREEGVSVDLSDLRS